jgi:hypothetical protein
MFTVGDNPMDRTYLYASPEDYPEIRAAGAHWDEAAKSWYIAGDMAPAAFSQWLGEEEEEASFGLSSDEAYVACAQATCVKCQRNIEVICLYCDGGIDAELDEPLAQITVSNIWAMDAALAQQLEPWPGFRPRDAAGSGQGEYLNHCPHCGAAQEEELLHAEPRAVFFSVAGARAKSVKLVALEGRVQLSGDYGFEV